MSQHLVLTMKKGMYQGEETLEENLSKETYRLAGSVLKKHGMDISFYQKFRPWFLALTLSGIELMKMGYDPNFGVDKYFIDRAASRKILELEGIAYQINLFDGFSKEENDRFLFYSLQELFRYQKELDQMVHAWQCGDAEKMDRLLKVDLDQNKDLNDIQKIFIDDRNAAMAEKIFNYLESGKKYFVVVGAAHLIGTQGIVKLLEQKGVRVQQR
jgi:uncharacterized protein YbaP (TraB family)